MLKPYAESQQKVASEKEKSRAGYYCSVESLRCAALMAIVPPKRTRQSQIRLDTP